MTESDTEFTPGDDPEYWKPIVKAHLQDWRSLRKFVSERRHIFPFHERSQLDLLWSETLWNSGIRVTEFAGRASSRVYCSAYAGVLKQANHELREAIIAMHPELADKPPELGSGGFELDR
ncbi:MAG: hypothetical protein JWP89_4387 [Schlesneria sp.]|nr:hypothetical protein [Schlesneria sp.]